jgi:hypothetical protein
MTGTRFNLVGEVRNRHGGGERAETMMRKLGWWLGFMFGKNWCGDAWGGVPELI